MRQRHSDTGATATPVRHSDIVEQESLVGVVASWASLVASFALSAATWIALATLAGYDESVSLSPLGLSLSLYLSWAMPVAVDGYVITALVTWMAPVSDKVARFAKVNTYAAAAVGVVAQSAYHATAAWQDKHNAWLATLSAAIGTLPPMVSALSVHLRALVRRAALERAAAAAAAVASVAATAGDTGATPVAAPVVRQSQVEPVSQPVAPAVAHVAPPAVAPMSLDVAPVATPPAVAVAAVAPEAADVAPVAVAPAPVAATPRRRPATRRGDATRGDATRGDDLVRQDVRRRVRRGESCAAVAASLDVTPRTVQRWTQDLRTQTA